MKKLFFLAISLIVAFILSVYLTVNIDIVKTIETTLKSLSEESINNTFFLIIFGSFVATSLYYLFNIRKKEIKESVFVESMPTILTTLGILGTFTGVLVGLLNFDTNHIDESISALLSGMKTAFLTSIIGVTLSIILKLILQLEITPKDSIPKEEINLDNIVKHIFDQTKNTQQLVQHSEALHQAIGSDTDQSLISQLRLLRSDLSDRYQENKTVFTGFQTELWNKLQDFSDVLSKSATETVINALKEVITDFNHNLTEQFGENFKQLNQAVLKLVEWQENYKTQLAEMKQQYQLGVQAISQTEASITEIEKSSQAIPQAIAQLEIMLTVNQHQIQELENHLSAFATLRDKAVESLPVIQDQIELMVNNVESATQTLATGIQTSTTTLTENIEQSSQQLLENSQQSQVIFEQNMGALTTSSAAIQSELKQTATILQQENTQLTEKLSEQNKNFVNNLTNKNQTLLTELEQWKNTFTQTIETMQTTFSSSLNNLVERQLSETTKLMNGLTSQSENTLKTTQESVNKQLEMIDSTMQQEINRTMTEMGSALVAITSRFTEDYQRLVNEMSNVIQTGKR